MMKRLDCPHAAHAQCMCAHALANDHNEDSDTNHDIFVVVLTGGSPNLRYHTDRWACLCYK
jgi:hypothetical protein